MTTQRRRWLERLLADDDPEPVSEESAHLLTVARLGAAVDYIDNTLRSLGTPAMREVHVRDLLLDVLNILTNDEARP